MTRGQMRSVAVMAMALLLSGCLTGASAPTSVPAEPKPPAKPVRIVSMNPCVDAVLMDVAEPGQIAAISHYSHDPRATSIPLDQALRFPAVSGDAEDVIAADPDLVIAGPHVALQTIAALKRLGIPMISIPVPNSIAENKAQITHIAQAVGQQDKGETLNGKIDAALAQASSSAPPVSALIWQGSGLVPGKGTLADELLRVTGFENKSSALGLKAWDILSIEGLLVAPPDVLLTGEADLGAGNADGGRILSHPVFKRTGTRIRTGHFPSRFLQCAGPMIIPAVERLAEVRRALEAKP
jgi:iron complex transport system substrate-binding protein